MIKNPSAMIVLVSLLSCHSHKTQKEDRTAISDTSSQILTKKVSPASLHNVALYQIGKDSVTIAPFEIGVILSPKATAAINKGKETIIISLSFTGTPKDSSKASFQEDGSFFVASAEKEISYGQVAQFNNIKFSKKLYDRLADKDIDMDVNVFSGRKSSPDNLLDCEFLSDKISNVVNKKFILKGKLIYGDD
jgi:hypothetical protein